MRLPVMLGFDLGNTKSLVITKKVVLLKTVNLYAERNNSTGEEKKKKANAKTIPFIPYLV